MKLFCHRNAKALLLLSLTSLFTGCATVPTPTAEVKAIPPNQVLSGKYFRRANPQQVKVLIKRDRGFYGSGGSLTFTINGSAVAKLSTGEGATIYLDTGRYLFGVRPSFSVGKPMLTETDILVSKDVPQIYRIYCESDQDAFHVARTSE